MLLLTRYLDSDIIEPWDETKVSPYKQHILPSQGVAMIGLSVSFCIRDIVNGTVPLANVEKIIGSIAVRTELEVADLIKSYCQVYWRECSQEAEKVFRQLLAEGKIEQPRLDNSDHFPMLHNHIHWVESEDQIIWYDRMESYVG